MSKTFLNYKFSSCLKEMLPAVLNIMKFLNLLNLIQAKKLDKKLDQVALTVSLRGIRMEDCSTGDLHFEFSIYRLDTSFNWF